MKFVLSGLVLLASFGVMADQELRVVARDYSITAKCETAMIDDSYKGDGSVMVEYTFCKGIDVALSRISSRFQVVLKVEGMDSFSKAIIASGKVQGNYVTQPVNVRVIGVVQ